MGTLPSANYLYVVPKQYNVKYKTIKRKKLEKEKEKALIYTDYPSHETS